MPTYTLEELAKSSGVSLDMLQRAIARHSIAPPNPAGNTRLVPGDYFLFAKVAKILGQNLTPEVEEQKLSLLARNRKYSATISDVASLAGVSTGAVSRVLNNISGKINISEKTRARILEAARELGYRPNPFASALRSRKSGVIGAVIRDITDQFMQQLIGAVQSACNERGLDILMSHAKHEKLTTEHQIKLMLHQFFDGLIILGDMEGDEILMEQLSRHNTPIVSLDGRRSDYISTVRFDDARSGRMAFDYLASLGHRRIAYIGNMHHSAVRDRVNAFADCWRGGHPGATFDLVLSASTMRQAMSQCERLLEMAERPTAVVCSNDVLAQGAINAVWRKGMRVPDDLSVLGFDDIVPLCEAYQLTTIQQPLEEASSAAVTELQRQIRLYAEGGEVKPVSIVIEPRLLIRNSCAAPA